jgi:hypothetical protein
VISLAGQPVQSFSLRFYAAAAFLVLSGVRVRLALSWLPVFLRQIACVPGQRFGVSPFSSLRGSSLAVLPFWRQRAPDQFLALVPELGACCRGAQEW